MKNLIIGSLLFIFTFSANINAADNDFNITVPSNWVEFPKDILAQYSKALRESTGSSETHEHGFQLNTVDKWFTYPYTLIQIKRSGRIPDEQLKQYRKFQPNLLEGLRTIEDSLQETISNSSQGETLYEPEKNILWSIFSMDVANIGPVKGVIAIKLTEYGFIQLVGYAIDSEFDQYLPLYKSMAESIVLSEEDEYKPRTANEALLMSGIDVKQVGMAALIGIIIAGAFAFLLKFRRKDS